MIPTKIAGVCSSVWQMVKAHWVTALVLTIVIIGGLWWYAAAHQKQSYQLVTVTTGPIVQTVSLTGNTEPAQSVSLGFRVSGTIAHVYHGLGDAVVAGETVAVLDTAGLRAALQQAEAAYASAIASRSSTSLSEAEIDARNTYVSAYTTLDIALHSNADLFFGNPTAYGPELLINAPTYNFGEFSRERRKLTLEMDAYHQEMASASTVNPLMLLDKSGTLAQDVSVFLNKLAVAAQMQNSDATSAQLAGLATARSSVDTLLAKISAARDAYRSSSVGATSLADASVQQAAAGVAVAEANLQGTSIVAPISGVINQQDAKVGQLATAATPLVSIISNTGFEVDAGASETDIGMLSIGDSATLTLDAFPNEVFHGKVFYIAPAETNTQGVVSYLVKISLDTTDPRIKSGLTANLEVETDHKDAVLILPQYAIVQEDAGTFVEKLVNGVASTSPVILGIQDQKGNVEILSGVVAGEHVINIGLRKQ